MFGSLQWQLATDAKRQLKTHIFAKY